MSEQEALDHAASVLADYTHGSILAEDIDAAEHGAIGTPWGAALSSFLFFASGAFIPIVPFLFGAQQYVAVALSTSLVGVALLLTGACVGVLSGSSPMRRALRQLAIGLGAAAATYALGLAFGGGV